MTTVNYTPLLQLALPTTGDLQGTWGVEVNNAITSLLDSSVAGTVTLNVDTDVTLTAIDGTASQARNAIIVWAVSGGTVTRTITAPAKSKIYVVINASATQSIKLVGAGPTTGVTINPSEKCVISWSSAASDFVRVASSDGGVITGVVQPDHGGTGISSYTAGDTIYASGPTTISKLPIGAANRLLTSSGTAPQWTDPASVTVGGLLGGAANQIVYQSTSNATTFVVAPTTPGTVLNWNGTTFDWASAPAATSATNLAGGAANRIAYQTAPGTTSFLPAPTVAGSPLTWNGTSIVWGAAAVGTVTSVNVSGGTTGLSFTGGPITTSGTITASGTLSASNGGTGVTPGFTGFTGTILLGTSFSTWGAAALTAGSGISIAKTYGASPSVVISNTGAAGQNAAGYFACQFG